MPGLESALTPGAIGLDFDGGLVLVDEKGGRLFVYEGDARSVWDAVVAGASAEEIRTEVRRGGSEEAFRAVEALLDQWQRDGLAGTSHHRPPMAASPKATRVGSGPIAWRARVGSRLIGFTATAPEMARQLKHILGVSSDEDRATDAELSIEIAADGAMVACRDGIEIVRTADDGLLRGAVYKACLDILYGFPAWRSLIHGAAVGREGSAIALPAPSGSGKTTLTAWLVSRGFDYLADDLVAVLDDGRIAPWPLPISVKAGSLPVLSRAYPDLAEAPAFEANGRKIRMLAPPQSSWSRAPLPLAMFVFPRFDPAGDGVPRRLRPLDCLARLASDRVWMGFPVTRRLVEDFLAWLEPIPAHAIDYADLNAAERAIIELQDGASRIAGGRKGI